MFGEMAEALLLASVRAVPGKLDAAGYAFARRRVDEALEELFR
jgi:NAD dependent epimerase/dehydratase family enzyme